MHLVSILEGRTGLQVRGSVRLTGGDINEVYKVHFEGFEAVVKVNEKGRFEEMFAKEAKGLDLIRSAGCLAPGVIDCFEDGAMQFLLLEFIEEGRPDRRFWEDFGRELSDLHRLTNDVFGLDHDNFIGSLEQSNEVEESWQEFFVERRIRPQVSMARRNGLLTGKHEMRFESLYERIGELVPDEPPSLLHGDLWSGNLMCSNEMRPVFIDPAVYFGHREVDIAMTQMFGGFNSTFMASYDEAFPLERGWKDRIDLYKLYPTLVHVNLFGSSYLGGLNQILQKYS